MYPKENWVLYLSTILRGIEMGIQEKYEITASFTERLFCSPSKGGLSDLIWLHIGLRNSTYIFS